MKMSRLKPLLPLLVLFSFSFVQHAPAQGPRLIIKEPSIDAGSVKQGAVISHDFKVLNHGDAPLEIHKVSPG